LTDRSVLVDTHARSSAAPRICATTTVLRRRAGRAGASSACRAAYGVDSLNVLVEFMRSLGTGFDHDKAVIERPGAAESLERIDRLNGGKGPDAQE
jgi:hypothetical protein